MFSMAHLQTGCAIWLSMKERHTGSHLNKKFFWGFDIAILSLLHIVVSDTQIVIIQYHSKQVITILTIIVHFASNLLIVLYM